MTRVDEFLELSCLHYGVKPGTTEFSQEYLDGPARWGAAWAMLAAYPELPRVNLATAVVTGEVDEVRRMLTEKPSLVREKFGNEQWEPILFLCYGRIEGVRSAEVLRLLLNAGADVNVSFTDGENLFTPLTGVMGEGEQKPEAVPPHAQAAEMAAMLLDAEAPPVDRQGLYNTALWWDEPAWLETLHARGGDWTEVLPQLLQLAVPRNHLRRAAWLLEHGAEPGKLMVEAARRGLTEMRALLEQHGGRMPELSDSEAYQIAVLAGNREEAGEWLNRRPELRQFSGPLIVAAERGRVDVIEMLNGLGVSLDLSDCGHQGKRAVHAAAAHGQLAVIRKLIELGADIDARDEVFGSTAIRWAEYFGHEEIVRALVQAPER